MSLDRLMKIVEADDKKKSANQENNTPEPKNDVDELRSETTGNNDSDPGRDESEKPDESNPKTGDKPNPETPKDKSKLSDKEKAEYAFRKQFAKQDSKYKTQLEQMRQELEDLKKNIAKPEAKITRDNFETDEDYEDWRLDQKAQNIFDNSQKKQLEAKIEEQSIIEQKTKVTSKVQELYSDPKDLDLYNKMIQFGIQNGLEDALNSDNGKDIKKFIDNSTIGPRVLQHLIGFPNKFNEIFNMDDTIDKRFELKMLERELLADIQFKKNQTPDSSSTKQKPNVPVLGKLGSTGSNNQEVSLNKYEADREALKFIRGR
jgi:chemotaxis protein histidine kinase CheA